MSFWDAVGDAVSGAASSVADVATDAYHGACAAGSAVSGAVNTATKAVGDGVGTAEHWVDENSHALANKVADVPVVGTAAQMAADAATTYTNFEGGVVNAATGMVGGVANAVAHPLDTVNGLNEMASHMPG